MKCECQFISLKKDYLYLQKHRHADIKKKRGPINFYMPPNMIYDELLKKKEPEYRFMIMTAE